MISLGCPKNRVDSEVMLGGAFRRGLAHVDSPEEADVIVVNTCGFIEAAKEESIDTIMEMVQHRKDGRCQKLVVAGCLVQKYSEQLSEGIPEVDYFIGSSDMPKLEKILRGEGERVMVGNPADWVLDASSPRTITTRGASAFLKIAEGCNRSCSFCTIPQMRGKQRSRRIEDVVEEAKNLAAAGVLELNLISQDTIAYGRDLKDETDLAKLITAIGDVEGIEWIRVFYLYPEKLTHEVVDLMAKHPKVVPYVDMPLQHAADGMLKRMRRGCGGDRQRRIVERVRQQIPNVIMRTAFIVGHPGETEEEFEELVEFVKWARFDHVGVFRYSDEEDCQAFEYENKVSEEVAAERAEKIMAIQREISRERLSSLVGKEIDILIEGPSEESELVLQGRHAGQAPEIDGLCFISGGEAYPGTIRRGKVVETADYDLVIEIDDLDPELVPKPRPISSGASLGQRDEQGRLRLRTVSNNWQ